MISVSLLGWLTLVGSAADPDNVESGQRGGTDQRLCYLKFESGRLIAELRKQVPIPGGLQSNGPRYEVSPQPSLAAFVIVFLWIVADEATSIAT
jgi:hypothetical protein